MRPNRKRSYKIKESDFKSWNSADSLILKFLEEHGESKFGQLFNYVNSQLDSKDHYSKKGFALRLCTLREEGKITRRKIKQNHYLYYLTEKGKESVELIAAVFRGYSGGLLRTNFANTPRATKGYFVERIITRVGLYMLFSCIDGILNYTSKKNTQNQNVTNMKQWIDNTNPGVEIINYLDQITTLFLQFKDEKEAESFVFTNKKKRVLLQELQENIKKKHHNEYEFLYYRKKFMANDVKNEKESRTPYFKKKMKAI